MATKIKKTNGDVLVTIPEGEIDASATPLELIGEGAEDWIVAMNQNWVRSLENFAGSTPPVAPLLGQFWFDTATRTVKFWDGDEWLFLNGRSESTGDDAEDVGVPSEEGGAGIDQTILDAIEAAKVEIEAALAEGQRLYEERERLAADARAAAESLLLDGQDLLNDRVDDAFAQLALVDPLSGSIGERVIQHQQAIDGQAILIAAVESVADNANAAVQSLSQAITDADYATAEDLTVVRSALEDDLAATNAQVSFLANTVSGGNGSISTLIEGVRTDFEAADADLTSEIFELRQTTTTATEAAADRLDLIESDINTPTTGLKAKVLSHTTTLADLNTNKVSIGDFQILEAKAVAKAKTYVGTTLPTNVPAGPLTAGDIFYKTNENNRVYRWSGTAWAPVDDTRSPTFVAATAPAAGVSRLGDLWVKTPEKLLYRFDGTNWIKFEDPRVGQVVATVQSHTDVIADLPNNYAGATVFNQIKSEVEGARNGKPNLAAEIGNVRQVITDGLNLKASAADLNLLKAEVEGARNGSANLSAQLLAMRTATSDGLALKATATEVNNIRTEVSDARNGSPTLTAQLTSMRTATSDGLALKASASEFGQIKAEVEGARNGSANLNAQLQTMRTATSDGLALKATATEVNTIRAEMVNARNGKANLSAELTSMRTATSDGLAGKAAATRVDALEVAARSLPNLIRNGDFARGISDWGKDQAGTFGSYQHAALGTIGYMNGPDYAYTATYPVVAGDPLSVSFEGDRGGGDGSVCLQWLPDYISSAAVAIPAVWGVRAKLENVIAPPGATGFRVVVRRGTASHIHFTRFKVNYGSAATNWSDEGTVIATNARITNAENVILDLPNNYAAAASFNQIKSEVEGARNGKLNLGAEISSVRQTVTDGLNLKVDATEYNTLKAEITNARNGKPSVSALLADMRQATVDGDNAAGLRLNSMEAATRSLPNLIKNGDFTNGLTRWERDGAGPASDIGTYYHNTLGTIGWIKGAVSYIASDFYPINPGNAVSLSFEGERGGGNGTACIQWLPGYAQTGHVAIPTQWGVRAKSENNVAPAGATHFRVVIGKGTATQIHFARVKVNADAVATNWSNEASVYDTNARIGVVETVTTNGTFATANRVNDLQATLQTRNNLCPNGGLENGLTGLTGPSGMTLVSNGWGPQVLVYDTGTSTQVINFPKFSVFGGNWYTISGDTVLFAASNHSAYLDLIFFDAAGNVVQDGPEKAIYGQHDFSNAPSRLQDHAAQTLAPANAVTAQARAVFSATNATVIGVRRVKVEMGQLPATQYTAEASGVQAGARIKVVEDVTTNGTFATASTTSQISARVDAQGGNLLINTDFQSGTGGWSPGGQVVTPLIVNGAGDPWHPVGENVIGFNVQGNAGYSDINSDRVSVEPGKWYDLSAYIACHRANANMYIGWFNAAGTNLGYNDGPGEFVPGAGGQNLAGFTRRWFKAQAPANATYAFVIFRKMATNQSNDSWMWVCRPMFGECSASTTSVRPFSHGNSRQLAGQITDARNIAVDTRGRVQATAGLTVQAGSRVAGMKFHATDGSDQSYSSIDFNADTFRVWDTNTNTGIPPFEIRNGGVRMKSAFVDRLSVGTSITLGSGIQFRVAVQPIDVSVTDGQSVNFGYDLGANPTLQFAGNNLAPLNAGETYNLYAENLSPTGFIARLKISTPATPSNLNTGLMGASANGPTTHHAYLDQYGGRTNSGSYNVRVVGYNRVYRNRFQNPGGYYEYQPDDPYNEVQGETWITVYGWNGGAWVELSTIWIGPTFSGANGYTDQYFDQTESVQTGSNISHIGVAVTNRTFAESRVDNLGINWQTQGAGGGLRSATPNGQVSSVTIRPRT
ncbi:DUF1983 domain-containing protein [Brevundimonas sp. SGAir0440]|uniref:phage tail tip fiber protein n=1 Tax=Brevundimonas sp. SGAir0440 TaxID=2579977 RepID=UPI0010CD4A50|nr:DUF1983 domain-containing protein [Brevundimonas sp. SGAir0440]QCQ98539.1 DUF1983 domain-containing protein [Brevundimonas sp. SGAir0440]